MATAGGRPLERRTKREPPLVKRGKHDVNVWTMVFVVRAQDHAIAEAYAAATDAVQEQLAAPGDMTARGLVAGAHLLTPEHYLVGWPAEPAP